MSTTRLLKSILPGSCLWTSLRDVEGYSYDQTLKALRDLFGGSDDEDIEEESMTGIPEAIRSMLGFKDAVEALGSMMWLVSTPFVALLTLRSPS